MWITDPQAHPQRAASATPHGAPRATTRTAPTRTPHPKRDNGRSAHTAAQKKKRSSPHRTTPPRTGTRRGHGQRRKRRARCVKVSASAWNRLPGCTSLRLWLRSSDALSRHSSSRGYELRNREQLHPSDYVASLQRTLQPGTRRSPFLRALGTTLFPAATRISRLIKLTLCIYKGDNR